MVPCKVLLLLSIDAAVGFQQAFLLRLPYYRSGLLAVPRRLHARRALHACQSCRSTDAVLASQTALHNGTTRTVWQLDTTAWLDGNVELDKLPPRYNVITSLPDISELGTRRHRMLPQQYESWFVDIVVKILKKVPPQQVAIFYQTSGRTSGVGGTWLDKGFLCQLAARQAGAACVWHKMILDGPPGLERAGRPGFVDMLCFSKEHRMPASGRGFKTVDVMYRGSMTYHKAMGQNACLAAVDYCARWVDSYTPVSNASVNLQEDSVSDSSTLQVRQGPKDTEGLGALSSLGEPVAVLDPFCGYGSVLAVANCRSVAAYGIDVDPKSCRRALEFTLSTLDT